MILLNEIAVLKEVPSIFNPESLIRYGGLLILFLVVYAQTGLFFAFFLPSGALLFTSGVFISTGDLPHSLFTLCASLIFAAWLGNLTGYWFGRKAGPLLYKRKDSTFFRRQHIEMAEDFYKKYGGVALTAGLFLPIIRTFAPIVAGMINLNFQRFVIYTFTGSILWIVSMVSAGYILGKIPFLKGYLNYIIIIIVIAVTVPIVIRIIKEFKKVKINNEKKI